MLLFALALAVAPTPYNTAFAKATGHRAAGDALLVKADEALADKRLMVACATLNQAMIEWQLASISYLKAGASPATDGDADRVDDDRLKAATDALLADSDQAQKIYDENCRD